MRQHVAVQRIDGGVVDIRLEYAFAQVVENDHATNSAEPAKCFLVQLGPDAGAGSEREQTDAFAAVAEGQHEQPGASVLPTPWVTHHWPVAIINLRFFAGCRLDHDTGFRRTLSAELPDEALDALIVPRETVLVHQVLPDRLGVTATRERQFD